MRVLVDTDVVVSALLFPQLVPAQALEHVAEHAELALTPWVLDELVR
ncbi:MAG: hypothetical protein FWD74_01105 [Actinomycetia bacterium]|nr:hypothetical protein [Actinomycetes bacterium]